MRTARNSWSLDAGAWRVTDSPECVTFTPPSDQAALQVSASRREAGQVSESDLRSMAERTAAKYGVPVEVTQLGHFAGFAVEFEEPGHHWRRWWVAHGRSLLFITYNTAPVNRSVDRGAVDAILASLRPQSEGDA